MKYLYLFHPSQSLRIRFFTPLPTILSLTIFPPSLSSSQACRREVARRMDCRRCGYLQHFPLLHGNEQR